MKRRVYAVALLIALAVSASAQTTTEALAKANEIRAEAQYVLDANAKLPRKHKLPIWVTDAQYRILSRVGELEQVIIRIPTTPPPPAGAGFTRPCTVSGIALTSAAIQEAVDAASENDVLCLSAGTGSLTATVNTGTKAVTIRGAGDVPSTCPGSSAAVFTGGCGSAGQTTLYYDNAGHAGFNGLGSSSNATVFENIKFTFDENSGFTTYGILTFSTNTTEKPPIIRYNDFVVTGTCQYPRLLYFGSKSGFVARNRVDVETLESCNYINTNINFIGHFITDDGSWWGSASTFGDADTTGESNLYVENNWMRGMNVAIDQNTSSRAVWRFNENRSSTLADHGYDSSAFGNRHWENYGNHFICDQNIVINVASWIGHRGGTGKIFGNTFDAFDNDNCNWNEGTSGNSIFLGAYKLIQADTIKGWPGLYPDTYPLAHQTGWGWISGQNQAVGESTAQNDPGGAGFQQALEPISIFNNTINTSGWIDRAEAAAGESRVFAYGGTRKTGGTTVTVGAFVSTGQDAVVVCGDLAGGSAPTISDDNGETWTAIQGGTTGSLRMSGWRARIANGGDFMTVTVTFGDATDGEARTCVLGTLRAISASGFDVNPAVVADSTSPYVAPASGTLAQADELVLGYFALQGPTQFDFSNYPYASNDNIAAVSPDFRAIAGRVDGFVGIAGTTGGTADTNVSVALTYRLVSATTSVQPSITNSTANRTGLAGTMSFKNTGDVPWLLATDFIQHDREYRTDENAASTCPQGGGSCTSGVGVGTRAQRPANCTTGVEWWSTDQGGNWNTVNGTANDGTLDRCTSTNNWTNGVYTPKTYPDSRGTP